MLLQWNTNVTKNALKPTSLGVIFRQTNKRNKLFKKEEQEECITKLCCVLFERRKWQKMAENGIVAELLKDQKLQG